MVHVGMSASCEDSLPGGRPQDVVPFCHHVESDKSYSGPGIELIFQPGSRLMCGVICIFNVRCMPWLGEKSVISLLKGLQLRHKEFQTRIQ